MVKYMNDITSKTEELVASIKNSEDYKEYIELRDLMSKDKDILRLIEEVKSLQKKIIKKEYNREDTTLLKDELIKKQEQLEMYPIYCEYNDLQSKLNVEIQVIKDTLEVLINKITN